MSYDDNLPAFPCSGPGEYQGQPCTTHYLGITMREYFAAKAMQALVARADYLSVSKTETSLVAKRSLEFADALLAELKSQTPLPNSKI